MLDVSTYASYVYVPVKDSYERALKSFIRLCKYRNKLNDCKRKKYYVCPSQERKQKLNAIKLKYSHKKQCI